jgi:hypothetical protein
MSSISTLLQFNGSGAVLYYADSVMSSLACVNPPQGCVDAYVGSGSFQQAEESASSFVIASTAATPVPATLPLLAGGLSVMGLLVWRRKRKAAAIAVA